VPHPEKPSYEDLAARVAELLAVVAEQAALIGALRAEVASLRRQAGRDSPDSSQPPSQDGPAAEARAKAGSRRARPARPQGGQKGHPGAGLQVAARPDETRVVEPGTCGGCGADLAGAPGRVASAVQVFDVPPAALTVTEYQMMRRTCGCGQVTTAAAPPGVTGGPACYGPGVADAAALLASTDVIGIERAADLMGALLKAPVSTGFVSRCLARLDAALTAAGSGDALKGALRAADVLGTDETPAPLTAAAASAEGCGNPHVYTVRTMNAYTGGGPDLIWYGAAGNRTKLPITGFGILDGYRGILVRDDCEPVPPMAQGQPPRPRPGQAAQAQGRPGLALRGPLRRARHEQRIGERHPRLQARRENQRLLAHPRDPPAPLPHPLLPGHRPQPRPPPSRRHPRRPPPQLLDAATPNMIN